MAIWKLNVISSLPSWMKSWVYPFLNWMGVLHEFREAFFFIAAESLLIHFRNIQVPCNGQSSGFACDFSHRKNLTRQRSYHSRYQTKGSLIAGIILNSVTFCFRWWISGSTHSLISASAFAIMSSLLIRPFIRGKIRRVLHRTRL